MMMWCDISESMHMLQSAGLGVGWRSDKYIFWFYQIGFKIQHRIWTVWSSLNNWDLSTAGIICFVTF